MLIVEERRGTRCEEGGRRRGAPGFALEIVVTGARELCEAVETVGAGCRDFVMCHRLRLGCETLDLRFVFILNSAARESGKAHGPKRFPKVK